MLLSRRAFWLGSVVAVVLGVVVGSLLQPPIWVIDALVLAMLVAVHRLLLRIYGPIRSD